MILVELTYAKITMNQFVFDVSDYPDLDKDSNGWKNFCVGQFGKEYFNTISDKIKENYDKYDGELEVFPPKELIFKAFELTPFEDVKVVLVGQGK